jgi:hypothetical protein
VSRAKYFSHKPYGDLAPPLIRRITQLGEHPRRVICRHPSFAVGHW